jgi:hypothetical protein
MLASKGQSDDAEKLAAQEFQRQQLLQGGNNIGTLQQSIMGDTLARDKMYMDEAKTGWQQDYLQKQMMKDFILQRLMSPSSAIQPTNKDVIASLAASGYKPFTPTLGNGWDQGASPFGREMSQNSLGQRADTLSMLSQGRGPQTDWTKMLGDSPQAQAMNTQNANYANYQTGARQAGPEKWLQDAIDGQRAQQAAEAAKKKGGGIGGALGGLMKIGGSVASMFPGIGTGIGAGLNIAGSKLQGNSWGDALKSGAMAAVPFGVGKVAGGIGGIAGTLARNAAPPVANKLLAPQPYGSQFMGGPGAAMRPGGFTGYRNPTF